MRKALILLKGTSIKLFDKKKVVFHERERVAIVFNIKQNQIITIK